MYGVSIEEFKARLARQGNRCAICNSEFRKTPNVDHDHQTGKIRGLLCGGCNTGMGNLGDSSSRLRAAADYLDAALDKPAPGGVS
jgi:hypothetical protein